MLDRAVASVLGQSFKDFELVIVDDGSTDETAAFLKTLRDNPRVRVLQTTNCGVSAARNLGLRNSSGTWVAFLDSDDEWLPEKLEKQWAVIQANPKLKIVHGEEIWIRNGRRVNPKHKHQKKGGDVFKDAVRLCCISPSTVLLRRDLLEKWGGFREDYPVCEDYDLWLKITAFHPVGFVEEPIIKKFGGHGDQLSRRYVAMDYWRIKSLAWILDKLQDPQKKVWAQQELLEKSRVLLKGYRKHKNLADYDEIFNLARSQSDG